VPRIAVPQPDMSSRTIRASSALIVMFISR
jgi:hypothetical protein